MAPEMIGGRFSGNPIVADPTKADIWCVGETFFQALTGSRTFDDESLYRYQKSLESFPVSKLEGLGVSQDGIDFISSLMAPDPRDRPDARQALGHAWMPADPDSFVSHEDDSAFWSNHDRSITSSAANIAPFDQLTQASAQWTTTSPLSYTTSTPTQVSDQWTATTKSPSRFSDSISMSDEVAPIPDRTNSEGFSSVFDAMEKLEQNVRIKKQELEGEVNTPEKNRREQKRVQPYETYQPDKDSSPIPTDFAPILTEYWKEQPRVESNSLPQAQGFEAAKSEQSRSTVPPRRLGVHRSNSVTGLPAKREQSRSAVPSGRAGFGRRNSATGLPQKPLPLLRPVKADSDEGIILNNYADVEDDYAAKLYTSSYLRNTGTGLAPTGKKNGKKKWSMKAAWNKIVPS